MKWLKKALIIDEAKNNKCGLGFDYFNIGNVYPLQYDFERAIEYFEKSKVIYQ